jgi:hypothetical protein
MTVNSTGWEITGPHIDNYSTLLNRCGPNPHYQIFKIRWIIQEHVPKDLGEIMGWVLIGPPLYNPVVKKRKSVLFMKEAKTQQVLQVCLLLHGKEWQLMHCQSSASLLQIPDQEETS